MSEKLGKFFKDSYKIVDTKSFNGKKLSSDELEKLWIEQGKIRYPSYINGDDLLQCKAEFPELKPIIVDVSERNRLCNLASSPEEIYSISEGLEKSRQKQAEVNVIKFITEVQAWKEKWFGNE